MLVAILWMLTLAAAADSPEWRWETGEMRTYYAVLIRGNKAGSSGSAGLTDPKRMVSAEGLGMACTGGEVTKKRILSTCMIQGGDVDRNKLSFDGARFYFEKGEPDWMLTVDVDWSPQGRMLKVRRVESAHDEVPHIVMVALGAMELELPNKPKETWKQGKAPTAMTLQGALPVGASRIEHSIVERTETGWIIDSEGKGAFSVGYGSAGSWFRASGACTSRRRAVLW